MIRHLHKLKKEKTNLKIIWNGGRKFKNYAIKCKKKNLKMNHPNWPNHIKNKTKILGKKQAKDFSLETKAIF
jgi:hypothetical protein